jgi:hypothetical protein
LANDAVKFVMLNLPMTSHLREATSEVYSIKYVRFGSIADITFRSE